jgi:tetraacyldisaccharide 4'-kinase
MPRFPEISISLMEPFLRAYSAISHRVVMSRVPHSISLPVPVCSIGNIAFGGTAKTPMVQYIAGLLAATGARPGIVLRGWRGRIDRENKPPAIVSDGSRIHLGWEDSGDEARLIAVSLLPIHVPVAVGRDRLESCRLLIKEAGVDHILLDDGFQYTSIARDMDIALIDALFPFGRHYLRPGPLREPVKALRRAGAIVLTRTEAVDRERVARIKRLLEKNVAGLPSVFTARTVVHYADGQNGVQSLPAGSRVAAFSGIGNPEGFRKILEGMGCDVVIMVAFPDHCAFREEDMKRVDSQARRSGSGAIVTTMKDAVKLEGYRELLSVPLHIVDIRMEVDEKAEFEKLVTESLARECQK